MLFWDVLREYYYVCYSRDYTDKTIDNPESEVYGIELDVKPDVADVSVYVTYLLSE